MKRKGKNSNYKISFETEKKKGISKKTVIIIIAAVLAVSLIIGVILYALNSRFPSPDFTVYEVDGEAVSLSEFKGKPIVVNIWASWCYYCVKEMPSFQMMYDKYGDEVIFLMVNATDGKEETKESAVGFCEEGGYTFPIYLDLNNHASTVYEAEGLPKTVFFDRSGNVSYSHSGMISETALEAQIRKILN